MTENEYQQIFQSFRGEDGELIPILQQVQEYEGYLSEESLSRVADFLKRSENEIYGVASFYSQFRFTPPGRNTIRVCTGTACHVRGGHVLSEAVEREYNLAPGETTEDRRFDLERVACLGCCALAPVVMVNRDIYSRMTVTQWKTILEKYS